jgi:hypothetical protein
MDVEDIAIGDMRGFEEEEDVRFLTIGMCFLAATIWTVCQYETQSINLNRIAFNSNMAGGVP